MASQPGSQVEVMLQASLVTSHLPSMLQRDEALRENFRACREAVLEAAQLYKDEGDTDKLQQLREQLLGLVSMEQQLDTHKGAMSALPQQYVPSLQATDFHALLQQHMDAAAAAGRSRPERDEDVQEFDALAGTAAAAGAAGAGEDSDEELVITGGEVNTKCPYTLKDLLDLKEPVEDQKGVVYEGEAVRAALRASRMGWLEAPVAGSHHRITLASLKPCRRVLRMQKQHARRGGVPAAAATQPTGRVLDV